VANLGEITMKKLIEFYSNGQETVLEVYAYALKPEELKDICTLLETKRFQFISIQADSLRAKISGKYDQINQIRLELEKNGWQW